jgi:phage tail-like protein
VSDTNTYGSGEVYGQALFGSDPVLSNPNFSSGPLQFDALDYQTLYLSWNIPAAATTTMVTPPMVNGLPTVHRCTALQLVRNRFNIPYDQNDGTVVFSQPNMVSRYTDSGLGGGFYYYSLFGLDGGYPASSPVWYRCGDTVALVPINWNYGYFLYNRLPKMYQNTDYLLGASGNPDPNSAQLLPPQQRFLQLLGFQLDTLRTEMESLLSVNDPNNVSGALLPLLADQLGLVNEQEMGMAATRRLVANAIHLYKLKGSPQGISEFVSTLTGWPVTSVSMGPNRLSSLDDGNAGYSLGSWTVNPTYPASSLNRSTNLSGATAALPTVTTNSISSLGSPTLNNTGWRLQNSSGTTSTVGALSGTLFGSDFPGFFVQFSLYAYATSATTLSVSSTEGGSLGTSLAAGVWTRVYGILNFSASGSTFFLGLSALLPAGASIYFTYAGAYNVLSPPVYDPVRDLKITVDAETANLFGNGLTTFGNGLDGWTSSFPLAPVSTVNSDAAMSGGTPTSVDLTQNYGVNTMNESVAFNDAGDTSGNFAVYGSGSLRLQSTGAQAPTIYGGQVAAVSTATQDAGWFAGAATGRSWFPGDSLGLSGGRTWFSDASGPPGQWFFTTESGGYFESSGVLAGGQWFASATYPVVDAIQAITILANNFYTFSTYLRAEHVHASSALAARLGFLWVFADNSTATSTENILLTNSLTRYGFSQLPPTGAVSFYCFVTFPGAVAGDGYLVNASMVEASSSINTYFDTSLFPGNNDYLSGTNGQSYYFENRLLKTERLEALLPEWLPLGASYTLQLI